MAVERDNLAQGRSGDFSKQEEREFRSIIACVDKYLTDRPPSRGCLTLGSDVVGTNERVVKAVQSYYGDTRPVKHVKRGRCHALRFFE